jgi:hypothetical protein
MKNKALFTALSIASMFGLRKQASAPTNASQDEPKQRGPFPSNPKGGSGSHCKAEMASCEERKRKRKAQRKARTMTRARRK